MGGPGTGRPHQQVIHATIQSRQSLDVQAFPFAPLSTKVYSVASVVGLAHAWRQPAAARATNALLYVYSRKGGEETTEIIFRSVTPPAMQNKI